VKHALIGAAIAIALIAVVIVGLRWHYQRGLAQRAAELLPARQDEAWAAARECWSVADSIEDVVQSQTGNLSALRHVEADRAARLADYVAQGLDARADVCRDAITKLEIYLHDSPTFDAGAIERLAWSRKNLLHIKHVQRSLRR